MLSNATSQSVKTNPVSFQELISKLRNIVGEQHLLLTEAQLRPYECDGLSIYRQLPLLAVLPGTSEEIRQVMQVCHTHAVKVVTRGAGTGLSAGALPIKDGILLVTSRLNQILDINQLDRCATVQPGVRNLAISEAARDYGLFYAPDPSSQIACSIGGNIAENAGGVHCLKYGLTVHNILKIKVVTASGEQLELSREGAASAGFNLLPLLIGSEGMLGIVTEITVKLVPLPTRKTVMLAAFDKLENAAQSVGAIIAAGIIPAGLEMMDKLAIIAAEEFVQAGYPVDAEAMLLIELDGNELNVEQQASRIQQVLGSTGAGELRIARDEAEGDLFWKGRKSAFPAVGRISPDYYCMDGTIPRNALAEVLRHIQELSGQYGLKVANVFHAGDGNLHPLILFDANVEGQIETAETMGAAILEKSIEVGGTITGEHGVGLEKIRQMPLQFTDAEIQHFHSVKQALDPAGILNPGKNIPLLKNCQEYRALAVGNKSTGHEHE